jgi:hypothetical protein
LALEIGCEDELNTLLQCWVKDKEKKIHDRNEIESNKENWLNISNPYQTRTKGASKKRMKNALEKRN